MTTDRAQVATRWAELSAVPARAATRRPDLVAVGALVALGVLFPLVADVWLHSLSVPRNDDFAYRATELGLVGTGHLHIFPWGAMTLVGQVLWAVPFVAVLGTSNSVPVLAMAPLCAIGLACAYYLARAALRPPLAVACVLLVLFSPGFLVNTGTFMTDVPGFAAQMGCLLLGWAALSSRGRRRWLLLSASLGVGIFAFSIRDFGAAAPAAVMACAFLQDRRHAAANGALATATALACLGTYALTRHLGVPPTQLSVPASHEIFVLGAMYFTLAFFVLPALMIAARRLRRSARWPAAVAALVTMVAGLKIHSVFRDIFLGNGFDEQGALPIQLGPGRPDVFPPAVWDLFNLAALLAGMLLAAIAVTVLLSLPRRLPSGSLTTLLSVFTFMAAVPVAAYCLLVRTGSFDRYIYPLVLPLAVLLVRPWPAWAATVGRRPVPKPLPVASARRAWAVPAHWRSALAYAVLATYAVLGTGAVLTTLNSDAYDRALWDAGKLAVAKGAPVNEVFDGFTWEGQYENMRWVRAYCAQVSNVPLKLAINGVPFHLEALVHWDDLGFAVAERFYVYKLDTPSCPRPVPVPAR